MTKFGWSRWVFTIVPGKLARPTDAEIKHNAYQFGHRTFGPSFGVKVSIYLDGSMGLDVTVAGHPVLDRHYVEEMTRRWRVWATEGFGEGTEFRLVMAMPSAPPPGAVRRMTL